MAATKKPTRGKHMTSGSITDVVATLPLGVELSNLDKVLYREQGITKAALVAYLAVVSDRLLPFVAGRPLALVRCPDGAHADCFFQKRIVRGAPQVIGRVRVTRANGKLETYMRVDDLDGLVALAQLGTLEIHSWGCRASDLEHPDLLVIDVDPGPGLGWDAVVEAALTLRKRLGELGLETFTNTTGGKGVHVVAPLEPALGWHELKAFARALCEQMAVAEPRRYVINPLKTKRVGRVFLDYLRNGRGATFIAPYSPRARAGATVATPIAWEELERGVDPRSFTVASVPERLGRVSDPWARFEEARGRISERAQRAVGAAA